MEMDSYQKFIFYRTYSRWLPDKGRREVWDETVDRYLNYIFSTVQNADQIPEKVRRKAEEYIKDLNVMPSMRALWSAGANADKDNAVFYNCAFLAADSLEAFGETLYLLACGCGVGYSVEKRYIEQLPEVKTRRNMPQLYFKIPDSREGWKEAVDFGVRAWFDGRDVNFDYSGVRPAGAPLITSGGYASGPDPLRRALEFLRETIIDAQGRQLTSVEISDMMNEIASAIVVGGVRRSSQIAICDLDDHDMATSKHGKFHDRRYMANVSAIYHKKPSVLDFIEEFTAMAKSHSGERGLFNLYAAKQQAPQRRRKGPLAATNPCGEIILRNMQFCNLTEVVVRPEDDEDSLRDKITTAVWLGAMQSCFTKFPHIRDKWRENCEEERLLGVSLTGCAGNIGLLQPEVLRMLRRHAVKVSRQVADILGINPPAAVTTGKPSGTVSLLVYSSAGVHSWWSEYFLRRTKISIHDPLLQMMMDQGMKAYPAADNHDTYIVEFPRKAPPGAKTRAQDTALQQLEFYKMMKENWAEHNISCTIFVADDEWMDVMKYVYDNFDVINGVSFFPKDDNIYQDAPFEEIDKETYDRMLAELPELDFSKLTEYEKGRDNTTGHYELACAGGACELAM